MDETIFFIVSLISGFSCAVLIWKLLEKKVKEKMEHEIFNEDEIVEGLKELKTYIAPPQQEKASKEYDLLELAIEYEVSDITIVNEEGLPIASTLADSEELAAKCSGVFYYIKKILGGDITKVEIKNPNKHIYIHPLLKDKHLIILHTDRYLCLSYQDLNQDLEI